MSRAYSGDIIRIKETGEFVEVYMRTSDTGIIDREFDSVITESGDIYLDKEYEIHKSRSQVLHGYQMYKYLEMSDEELYDMLRVSEDDFVKFMKYVRLFIKQ